MRNPLAMLLAASILIPGAASAGSRSAEALGLLQNPTLAEIAGGSRAISNPTPKYWTERGTLLKFSNRAVGADGYGFSMTGQAASTYPDATENAALHYEGSEGGYFQYVAATLGASVYATIESKGTAPQRLLLYARDRRDRNLGWTATVVPASSVWQIIAVDYANLPAATTHIVFVFRGRLLSPRTETFWFRNAALGSK